MDPFGDAAVRLFAARLIVHAVAALVTAPCLLYGCHVLTVHFMT